MQQNGHVVVVFMFACERLQEGTQTQRTLKRKKKKDKIKNQARRAFIVGGWAGEANN
jgi:hypothetical protein